MAVVRSGGRRLNRVVAAATSPSRSALPWASVCAKWAYRRSRTPRCPGPPGRTVAGGGRPLVGDNGLEGARGRVGGGRDVHDHARPGRATRTSWSGSLPRTTGGGSEFTRRCVLTPPGTPLLRVADGGERACGTSATAVRRNGWARERSARHAEARPAVVGVMGCPITVVGLLVGATIQGVSPE